MQSEETRILIGTPWNVPFISSNFCQAMVNVSIPFAFRFQLMDARHVPDARNMICQIALVEDYTHVLMIDADQCPPTDTFNRLWALLEKFGHDTTIAAGWTVLRKGRYAGGAGAFRRVGTGLDCYTPSELSALDEPIELAAAGSACLLFSAQVLRRITSPWFADVVVISEANPWAEGPDSITYQPVEFKMGQDLTFTTRAVGLGIKVMLDPGLKLPHEITGTI